MSETPHAIPQHLIREAIPILIGIFGELDKEELKAILSHLKWNKVLAGQYLFRACARVIRCIS